LRRLLVKDQTYNLKVPAELNQKLVELANEKNTDVMGLLRKFIKLGLIAAEVEKKENSALLIREDGQEREIIL